MLEPTQKCGASSASHSKWPASHSVLPSAHSHQRTHRQAHHRTCQGWRAQSRYSVRRRAQGISRATAITRARQAAPLSHLDQSVGTAARFLDLQGYVVHRCTPRRAALVTTMMGVTVYDGTHLESVDGLAQT